MQLVEVVALDGIVLVGEEQVLGLLVDQVVGVLVMKDQILLVALQQIIQELLNKVFLEE